MKKISLLKIASYSLSLFLVYGFFAESYSIFFMFKTDPFSFSILLSILISLCVKVLQLIYNFKSADLICAKWCKATGVFLLLWLFYVSIKNTSYVWYVIGERFLCFPLAQACRPKIFSTYTYNYLLIAYAFGWLQILYNFVTLIRMRKKPEVIK